MVLSSAALRAQANSIYKVPIDQGQELESLLDLIRPLHYRHGFIEIGAGAGGSFDVFASVIEGPAISIDYYDAYSSDPVEAVWGRRNLRSHRERHWRNRHNNVHALFRPSTFEETWMDVQDILGDQQVDFLFIDGRWQDVTENFEGYSQFVRKGGIVAIHCILQDRPDAEPVRALWKRLKESYSNTIEFPYGPHSSGRSVGGTGVIYV